MFCLMMKPHDTTVIDRHIVFIAKQHMHRNVWLADFSRPTCHDYGRKFGTKSQGKHNEKCINLKKKV